MRLAMIIINPFSAHSRRTERRRDDHGRQGGSRSPRDRRQRDALRLAAHVAAATGPEVQELPAARVYWEVAAGTGVAALADWSTRAGFQRRSGAPARAKIRPVDPGP